VSETEIPEVQTPGIGHNQPPEPILDKAYFAENFRHELENHVLACPRVQVQDVVGSLPEKYLTSLENNELIADCCRQPRRHDILAMYSGPADEAKKLPDIYVFICDGCGRHHRRFCVGGNAPFANGPKDIRPFWEVR
jgi:hypothetical protein